MAILRNNPIAESDLEEYLNSYSDFSFELEVLNKLIGLGFVCEHSGTYDDPITNKSREFDIRALYTKGAMRLCLSVECKNLHNNFPLITHCLQRRRNESYNEILCTYDPEKASNNSFSPSPLKEFARSIRLPSGNTLYQKGDYVAKSTDQVGRKQDGTIISTDGDIFDKISQAVNSAYGLISEAQYIEIVTHSYFSLIFPVLVIPDNTLWQVKYDEKGIRHGKPEKINRVSYFIDKEWSTGGIQSITYSISHLEIATFSELENFVSNHLLDHLDNCRWTIRDRSEFQDIPK